MIIGENNGSLLVGLLTAGTQGSLLDYWKCSITWSVCGYNIYWGVHPRFVHFTTSELHLNKDAGFF